MKKNIYIYLDHIRIRLAVKRLCRHFFWFKLDTSNQFLLFPTNLMKNFIRLIPGSFYFLAVSSCIYWLIKINSCSNFFILLLALLIQMNFIELYRFNHLNAKHFSNNTEFTDENVFAFFFSAIKGLYKRRSLGQFGNLHWLLIM